MKKTIGPSLLIIFLLFTGCLNDDVVRKYSFYRPVYKTTAEARAEIRSSEPISLSQPGKIYYKNGYVFLNELYKGVHVIDIRNINQPRVVSFVKIPGCVDMAVRGNILYADMYTDLVALDISNPLDIKRTHIVEGVFPEGRWYNYMDTGKVITDWIRVDTVVREKDYYTWALASQDRGQVFLGGAGGPLASSGGNPNGVGGSMARFALNKDRLYTVSTNDIKVFNTAVAEKPSYVKQVSIGWGIETIFPFDNYLFIGSTTGMYVFDAADQDNPVQKSRFEHARVCDPVISDGENAYVTLRSGTTCAGFTNQLEVVSVKDVTNPLLLAVYPMTNPHGLSKDGNTLLICEGDAGLRVLDASMPKDVKTLSLLKGFSTFDVIALGGVALVTAKDGLYFVNYTDPKNPVISSSLKITN
ncbi:MAG TPA: hypothetical protein VK166_00110 [Chitinophagaceae bacterium]|nr:hypothetical protein [Chitinophagaceae bacterium]